MRGLLLAMRWQHGMQPSCILQYRAQLVLPLAPSALPMPRCPAQIWEMQAGAAACAGGLLAAAKRGSGRAAKPSGAAAGKEPRTIVTGMEGLESLFQASEVYPAYSPSSVQAMHSGEGQAESSVAALADRKLGRRRVALRRRGHTLLIPSRSPNSIASYPARLPPPPARQDAGAGQPAQGDPGVAAHGQGGAGQVGAGEGRWQLVWPAGG